MDKFEDEALGGEDGQPSDYVDFEQTGPGLFDQPLADPRPACDLAHEAGDIPNASATLGTSEEAPIASGEAASEPDAPLALYRRYRPDSFAEVIGQEHVTLPLMRAIENNRINHAYLFSGPRGCGKTTSARILARCLNCAAGPTAHPCGVCDSCKALATGGPGSIDVIEIDAASHGRVDDARELREGVYFAPVNSRYKIYIIDEAHMVTKEGFNALLKVVEEPPPHVKFIFATTEPQKVLDTIRSRTHHYPFRLVPPKVLVSYLEKICAQEGVDVDAGVLPLVVRAGAGSVRDSLSVLDQLLGAADANRVSYEHATALLGYTPDSLLDEFITALASKDGQATFSVIDRVLGIGQDPKRFAEDLLQRLRDLVIVAQVPDAFESGLLDVAPDQQHRLIEQAQLFGPGLATRAADVIAQAVLTMRGTTSPRLYLELVCAQLLLVDADGGLAERVAKLEEQLARGGAAGRHGFQAQPPTAAARPAAAPVAPTAPNAPDSRPSVEPSAPARPAPVASAPVGPAVPSRPAQRPAPVVSEPQQSVEQPASVAQTAQKTAADYSALQALPQHWPQLLDFIGGQNTNAARLIASSVRPAQLEANRVVLQVRDQQSLALIRQHGVDELFCQAVQHFTGIDILLGFVVYGSAEPPVFNEAKPGGAPTTEPQSVKPVVEQHQDDPRRLAPEPEEPEAVQTEPTPETAPAAQQEASPKAELAPQTAPTAQSQSSVQAEPMTRPAPVMNSQPAPAKPVTRPRSAFIIGQGAGPDMPEQPAPASQIKPTQPNRPKSHLAQLQEKLANQASAADEPADESVDYDAENDITDAGPIDVAELLHRELGAVLVQEDQN